MQTATRPHNEEERLQALCSLGVLDTPPAPELDRVTRLAARLFNVPIALVSLLDRDRQWFKSRVGLAITETPRALSFCAHAAAAGDLLVVPDAHLDPRFRDNPLVTDSPHVRFYAGQPIRSRQGLILGTLCVIDTRPRDFDLTDRNALIDLSHMAEHYFHDQEAQRDARQAREHLARGEDLFARIVAGAAVGIAVISATQRRWLEVNQPLCALTGRSCEQILNMPVRDILHPDDVDTMAQACNRALDGHVDTEGQEVRLVRHDGGTVWVRIRISALRDADGNPQSLVAVVTDIHARKQAEQALATLQRGLEQRVEARTRELAEEKEHFRLTLKHASNAFVETDSEGRIQIWNVSAARMFGWTRAEMADRTPLLDSLAPPPLRATYRRLFERFVRTRGGRPMDRALQLQAMRRDGSVFPVEVTLGTVTLAGQTRVNAFLQDISRRKADEQALRRSEQRLRTITDNLPVMIARIGTDLRYTFHNRYYHECFDLPQDGLVGQHVREFWGEATYQSMRPALRRVLAGEEQSVEYRLNGRNGPMWLHASLVPAAESDGPAAGFYLLARDITEERRLRKRLQHEAQHDALTGLPNRRALLERIDEAMARARRSGKAAGVLFMDLDEFKTVNDTLGHEFGDAVLKAFAGVIRASVRKTDLVARIAGDEFAVVLENLHQPDEDAGYVAWAILERLRGVSEIQGVALTLSSSIGAAVHRPGDEETGQELLTRADAAMYRAKAAGKSRFSF